MIRARGRSIGGALLAVALGVASSVVLAAPLVAYCTHDPDARELAAQGFTRETGIVVAMTRNDDTSTGSRCE